MPACLICIEAGMAPHYVARELVTFGHDVKQVRRHMRGRFGKGTRMTSEMLTLWPRPCNDRRLGSFQLKPTNNWIYKRCTGWVSPCQQRRLAIAPLYATRIQSFGLRREASNSLKIIKELQRHRSARPRGDTA